MQTNRTLRNKRSLLLTICCLLYMSGCDGTCDIKDIEMCLRYVEPFYKHTQTIFPSYDDHTLGDVCRSLNLMENCLAPIKPSCSEGERQMYEGIEMANNYLCGAGLEQYRSYRVCFANAALTKDGNHCNFTYSKEMEKSRTNSMESYEQRAKKFCQDTDDFMKCVRRAVLRHCGDDAASWVQNLNIKVFAPLMDGIGCHEHLFRTDGAGPGHNVSIAVILGVALAIISILVSVVITSLVCRRQRRQSNAISLNKHTVSGSVEEKKQTKTDMFSQDRPSERKANIYTSSPQKKVAAVNGNVRATSTVLNECEDDSEKLLSKEGSIKDEPGSPSSDQVKERTDSGTYEQILNSGSPDKVKAARSKVGEEGKGLTVWPLPVSPKRKPPPPPPPAAAVPAVPAQCVPAVPAQCVPAVPAQCVSAASAVPAVPDSVQRPLLEVPSNSVTGESEQLLPPSGDWRANDSDLDSEGFPPPPPPICMEPDDLQEVQGQAKVNAVMPFAESPAGGYGRSGVGDPDQTEVKQVPPSMRATRNQRPRNSSLYEEEVDRLLEYEQRSPGSPQTRLSSLV